LCNETFIVYIKFSKRANFGCSIVNFNSGGTGRCKADEFFCISSKRCITARWVCDHDNDCEDGSDEANCGKKRVNESGLWERQDLHVATPEIT
jgi:Low-density lipoprotein receptor domain class A